MKFEKSQLKKLCSKRGIQYLLMEDKPNFKAVIERLEFEEELVKVQSELIKLQNWVVKNDARIMILFEGREFAGKGEAVRLLADHLNPRSMKLVALQKPTIKQRGQWYFKRYIKHIPELGEIVFFDRSWYNRALVEPVHGFCTEKEYKKFMKEVNHFERMISEDGIHLFKFYFSISKEEQHKRIEHIRSNPLKQWQLTKVDLEAEKLYDRYTDYKLAMFKKTNTEENPWHKIDADYLDAAVLEAARLILKAIPYNKG